MSREKARLIEAGFVLLLALVGCVVVQRPDPASVATVAALDAEVPSLLRRYQVASVSVAVIDHGQLVIQRAYGEQSPGIPATPDTLYNLASVTKPVTAEVLLRLVARGELSLDEPMSRHWVEPDVAADPRHEQLTLRIALSHQTGLPNWRGHLPGGKLSFTFAPGSAFLYSGEGYGYAARFAERKLGRSFEELADREVFGPLGMSHTSYSWRDWMQGRLAIPLEAPGKWGAPQTEAAGQWNAANNLITTAGDYARFVDSVMRGEKLGRELAAERLQPVRGPQREWRCELQQAEACPHSFKTVFGWNRLDFADGPVFMHTGSNGRPGGERTLAYFDPRRRRGVVILTSGSEGEQLYRDVVSTVDRGSRVAAFLAAK